MAGAKGSYKALYDGWKADPLAFWAEAAKAIDWVKPPTQVFDQDAGVYGRWFADGIVNTCYNALDRHVANGRADQPALYYDSPITDTRKVYTYAELLDEVKIVATMLKDRGVGKGDRVLLYMPMIPEAVIGMLACARIGAIHSVVFGGFAARELATRIDDCEPKAILSASCGVEPGRVVRYKPLLDQAIDLSAAAPETVFVLQRPMETATLNDRRDIDWADARQKIRAAGAYKASEPEPMAATDALYVLYTSGTSGKPKGVVRDTGGHMVALCWSMKGMYDARPGETFWAASDVGWVVGHSYICYAPLLMGCATIVFEGKPVGTPDPGTFWRIIQDYKVRNFFTAPTAFRAIKKEDPNGEHLKLYDISCLRTLFLAGERADPDTVQWAEEKLGVPVVDHWWQTETGWPIVGNPTGIERLPVKYGSPTVAMPGYDVQVLDEAGKPLPAGAMGSIAIRLPLPPGALPTLWRQDHRFKEGYLSEFQGYYSTSDFGFADEDGYLYIMGRTDDIINVAGHRLSTGGMEEVLSSHPDVAECAVIGAKDALKGETPLGFVVLKTGVTKDAATIGKECAALVRDKIGPVAAYKTTIVVSRLPKTRSGKILRGTMKKIADHDQWSMPATIDDPAVLDEITTALKA